MQEDAIAPAFAVVKKAKALAAKAGPREQALIAALALRYGSDLKVARAPFDAAYAAEMAKVAAQFPDDDEIAMLRRSWISAPGITGSRAAKNQIRRAHRSCRHSSAC